MDDGESEEILANENEGKKLAIELGAIFQSISAKERSGIDELYEKIGKKVLIPSYHDNIIIEEKRKIKKINKKGCYII